MKVILNASEIDVGDSQEISYESIVEKAGYRPDRILSVIYWNGRGEQGKFLVPGKSVPVQEGMMFDVCDTSHA